MLAPVDRIEWVVWSEGYLFPKKEVQQPVQASVKV
jgi:hypothetical protein